jgi:hypothetical protein
MRNRQILVTLGGLLSAAALAAAGCGHLVDDYYTPLTDPRLLDAGHGGSGGQGGDGGLPPECSGDPGDKNITDDCGVFARADAPAGGNGSQAKPFAVLGDAVTAAQSAGKRLYACAGAPFVEAVTISAGIEVWGGFDCAKGWAWSRDARAVLSGPADAVALTIGKNAGGAKVEGFAITAASPSDPKGGGSSIAVGVDDVTATLERCDVSAGDAADGPDGITPTAPPLTGADAPVSDPMTMNACINPGSVAGGAPGVTTCDDGTTSGGAGGKGGITGTNNGDGAKGADGEPPDATNGLGGAGESATKCAVGVSGKDGDPGPAGPGGSVAGDVLSLTGIASTDATDGKPGTKAQGGGGGGGAKSGMFCAGGVDGNGASGGGGGAGGCGGKGGGGGKAGGSSIAIVNLGTRLTLAEVTIAVGKAGKGGAGTAGQSGATGGSGAAGGAASGTAPSKPGCKGGDGGLGGPGGSGGGGHGGHAVGVAYLKAPSAAAVVKTFTPGTPGGGGAAGPGAPTSSNGGTGNAAQCWDFGTSAPCP